MPQTKMHRRDDMFDPNGHLSEFVVRVSGEDTGFYTGVYLGYNLELAERTAFVARETLMITRTNGHVTIFKPDGSILKHYHVVNGQWTEELS
jgi:hypothetical protein